MNSNDPQCEFSLVCWAHWAITSPALVCALYTPLSFPPCQQPSREGNGNPLQCSCLEKPRDRGAWWAAVYGVAQSRTRLKRCSSSSSSATWEAWSNRTGVLIRRDAEKKSSIKTQWDGSHLQARKRIPTRNQHFLYLDLELLTSRVWKKRYAVPKWENT